MTQLYKPEIQLDPNEDEIIYPDSDDEPMAENTKQYYYIVLVKEGLEDLFSDNPDVFIAADLFWYPTKGNPKLRLAPDVFVVFGRPKGDRMTYLQWEEDGIPPQVVFEIWSPGNRHDEKDYKLDFYKRHGVREYYTYDPFDGSLAGWQRKGGRWLAIPQMRGHVSSLLKIRFELEGIELTLYRPDGEVIVNYQKMAAFARQEHIAREQAENEVRQERVARKQVENEVRQERVAREEVEQQLEALLAKLKANNIDLNGL